MTKRSPSLDTFEDYKYDGFAVLHDLVARSQYKTIEQAVASLTLFSHPDTVAQTQNKPLFRVTRNMARRGEVEELEGGWIAYDDNKSPTDAFLWCNGLSARQFADVQFNHIYTNSRDPEQYCSLANLCVTPAFLAKLTDTHPDIRTLLQYRAFDLYGWAPADQGVPPRSVGFDDLRWAAPLSPVADVAKTVRSIFRRRPKDRTVQIVRRIGWLFSDYRPEPLEPTGVPEESGVAREPAGALPPSKGSSGRKQRDRLLSLAGYAETFSDPTFHFGETHTPPTSEANVVKAPYFALSDEALSFLEMIEENGWIVPFDWQAWAETSEGQALLHDPGAITRASADQLSKLLTALSRKERFSEGTLAEAFDQGLLGAIARRAEVLKSET